MTLNCLIHLGQSGTDTDQYQRDKRDAGTIYFNVASDKYDDKSKPWKFSTAEGNLPLARVSK